MFNNKHSFLISQDNILCNGVMWIMSIFTSAVLTLTLSAPGPEWDSFSALEFQALDRVTLFLLAFAFLLYIFLLAYFQQLLLFFEQGATVRGVKHNYVIISN